MIKHFLRNFLINLGTLWAVSQILPALVINEGNLGYIKATIAFMLSNLLLVPLLKILFLPLNLLTLGFFAWVVNVIALYTLVTIIPSIVLLPYHFNGTNLKGFIIPASDLSVFQVAIVASFLIGLITHFLRWLFIK